MSTFKNIQDDVLDLCQEVQGRADFSLTRVKRMINRGYYDFVRKTRCLQYTDDITTVANQISYTLDDDYVQILAVKYVYNPGGNGSYDLLLKPYPGGYINVPTARTYGTPEFYWVKDINTRGNAELGTEPTVDASGDTLRVYAVKMLTSELSLDADIPEMKLEYHDALVYYAVWRLFGIYAHLDEKWKYKEEQNKAYYDEMVNFFLKYEKPIWDIEQTDLRRSYEIR